MQRLAKQGTVGQVVGWAKKNRGKVEARDARRAGPHSSGGRAGTTFVSVVVAAEAEKEAAVLEDVVVADVVHHLTRSRARAQGQHNSAESRDKHKGAGRRSHARQT